MAKKKKLQPVSIAGIEFDALISEKKTMASTIPAYPVESGYNVSDTIILSPISISLVLYVTNTPVTWLERHGTSSSRVKKVCDKIEQMWLKKKLVKIVTNDTIYTNMGIENISIEKSQDLGYARQITVDAKKVKITKKKTVTIPKSILKSGTSKAKAGKASTSNKSSKTSGSSKTSNTKNSSNSKKSKSSSKKTQSQAKKGKSILYGAAEKLGFI
ncbi:MAG: hypothetical protein SO130_11065 [Agathobacter sp.]|nr:hypothetical protein [Agathobacter sp.]